MQEFTETGIWWLPENPEQTSAGTLTFRPTEGARLELIDSFLGPTFGSNRFSTTPIIHGTNYKGEKFTLLHSGFGGSSTGSSGYTNTGHLPEYILKGYFFDKEEDIAFTDLAVRFTNFDAWSGITGIRSDWHPTKNLTGEGTDAEVIYTFPEPIEGTVGDWRIRTQYWLSMTGDGVEEKGVRQETYLEIEVPTPLSLKTLREKVYQYLQNLVSFGMGEPTQPAEIVARYEYEVRITGEVQARWLGAIRRNAGDESPPPKAGELKREQARISIYHRIRDLPNLQQKYSPRSALFDMTDLADKWSEYLSNWFDNLEVLEPVFELYFGTLYDSSMFLEHQFTSLIQAVEVFHRRKHGGVYSSPEEFDAVYKALVAVIPEAVEGEYRENVVEKLKYLTEFSLKTRIASLFKSGADGGYGELLTLYIQDPERFVRDVVRRRNFLTHYSEHLAKKVKKGTDLYTLTLELRFVLDVLLMKVMGIEDDKALQLLSYLPSLRHGYLRNRLGPEGISRLNELAERFSSS